MLISGHRLWRDPDGGDVTFGKKAAQLCPNLKSLHFEGACFDQELLQHRHSHLQHMSLNWTSAVNYLDLVRSLEKRHLPELRSFRLRVEGEQLALQGDIQRLTKSSLGYDENQPKGSAAKLIAMCHKYGIQADFETLNGPRHPPSRLRVDTYLANSVKIIEQLTLC